MVVNVIIVLIVVLLTLMLIPVILEAMARRMNPTTRMNNADKRFIYIENVRTRDMFECIKR